MIEWETYRLGDLADITSSKRIFYSDYTSEGVPFFRSKEVIDLYNKRAIVTELFISEERFLEIKEKFGIPLPDDILLTSVGTLGIPYRVQDKDRFYFKDGNLTWFRKIRMENVLPSYLYIWLCSAIGKQKLFEITIGSTQSALTIAGLKKIELQLPPISQQLKITNLIDSINAKINLLHRQNETLEALAVADFKYSCEISTSVPTCDLLGSAFQMGIGRTPPRKDPHWFTEDTSDVKWISIKDLGNSGVYIDHTAEYLTEAAIKEFNIPRIPENTVLLSFKLTIGRVAITTEEMLSNEAIAHFKIKPGSKLFSEYLYLFLKSVQFESFGSTSSIAEAINSQMIKQIEIPILNDEALLEFKKRILPVFNKIKNNSSQMKKLKQLRDMLLPKLISGELKLKHAQTQ